MAQAYLRKGERLDLIQFVASRGEGYAKYVDYAKQRGWPLYKKTYYATWVQRKRKYIQEAREKIYEEIRTVDNYDRKKRIDECEESIRLIDDLLADPEKSGLHECGNCGSEHNTKSTVVIALLEQKRKFLEQIAKERNEWGKEDTDDVQRKTGQRLRGIIMEKLSEAKETTVSDGKVFVVRD